MKNIIRLLLLFGFATSLLGQDKEKSRVRYVKLELLSGHTVKGTLIKLTGGFVIVKTNLGIEKFEMNNVKNLKVQDNSKFDKDRKYKNYSDSYFFVQSARPVGVGNNYYSNYYLFVNQFNFGVTDRFSLGVGFETASITEELYPVVYIQPKYSLGSGLSYFSFGALLGFVPKEGYGGYTFVNYTYGTSTKNITFGINTTFSKGFGFRNEALEFSTYVINFSGVLPLSKKVLLISQVFVGSYEGITANVAVRVLTKRRLFFDLGLYAGDIDGDIGAAPTLSISVPLRK